MTAAERAPMPEYTPRGTRTRARIKQAARHIFTESGYAAARVADIVAAAKVSTGAFYRYFGDKREVLIELLLELNEELLAFSRARLTKGDLESVADTTERYLHLYRENHELIAVEIEVAQSDLGVRDIWNRTRREFFGRLEQAIRMAQERGQVRANLDPVLSSALLGGMTEYYAYLEYILKELPGFDERLVANHVMMLWGVGVLTPEGRSRPPSPEAPQ